MFFSGGIPFAFGGGMGGGIPFGMPGMHGHGGHDEEDDKEVSARRAATRRACAYPQCATQHAARKCNQLHLHKSM